MAAELCLRGNSLISADYISETQYLIDLHCCVVNACFFSGSFSHYDQIKLALLEKL